MPKIGTPENPLRVAIVGAGPSGFYAAEHILKDGDVHAQVDLFDRLPTPFGLVRGGVAPDHPKIKSVTRVYEKTAAREGFRFFGNVKIGHDIEVEELEGLYHAIVFTVGCETDRALGDPRRGPARQPRRHRLRRLVQRPSRLRRRGLRPLGRARRGDRQRQRGDGRRADAGADRPRAAPDRHRRPRDRGARQEGHQGDRRAGAPRPGPGRLHQPGDQGARGDGGRRRDRRPGRHGARPGERGLPRLRRGRQDDAGQRRDAAGVLRARRRRARTSGSSCASSPRRSRSRATARSNRS